jgi:hypothetical protein
MGDEDKSKIAAIAAVSCSEEVIGQSSLTPLTFSPPSH